MWLVSNYKDLENCTQIHMHFSTHVWGCSLILSRQITNKKGLNRYLIGGGIIREYLSKYNSVRHMLLQLQQHESMPHNDRVVFTDSTKMGLCENS